MSKAPLVESISRIYREPSDNKISFVYDGELNLLEIRDTLNPALIKDDFKPKEIILLCSQFNDIKTELREILGHNIKIHDSFDTTMREVCKCLKIRGSLRKLKI